VADVYIEYKLDKKWRVLTKSLTLWELWNKYIRGLEVKGYRLCPTGVTRYFPRKKLGEYSGTLIISKSPLNSTELFKLTDFGLFKCIGVDEWEVVLTLGSTDWEFRRLLLSNGFDLSKPFYVLFKWR